MRMRISALLRRWSHHRPLPRRTAEFINAELRALTASSKTIVDDPQVMPSPKSPSNNTEQNHPHGDGRFGHGKMNAQALYLASLLSLSLLLPAFVSPAPLSGEFHCITT